MVRCPQGQKGDSEIFAMGILNDVSKMQRLLCGDFGFEHFTLLNHQNFYPHHLSTYDNIVHKGFRWLMQDLRKNDSLVFYFSGAFLVPACAASRLPAGAALVGSQAG